MSNSINNQIQIQKNDSQTHDSLQQVQQLINYKGHPIKDKVEFEKLMQQSSLTFKKLQVYIVDLSTQLADKKVDPMIFREICQVIILNHLNYDLNTFSIKQDIRYLFDSYSEVTSADGIHYGDNTASKQVQFQKHVAKYPGGELKISDNTSYLDDDTFISRFIGGQKSGIALYTRINIFQCICAYKDDKKLGFGQYKWTDGEVYEGDFVADVRTGRGKYQFVSGAVYEGDFVDGKSTGKGVLKFVNGQIYEGDWKDGQRTGKGVLKFTNGDIFEGDWKDDNITGKGILKFANGDIYEGDFVDDKRCGIGICTFANGDIFQGEYIVNGDELTNYGTLIYANGDKYDGQMKYYKESDKRHRCGQGKLVMKNGEIQQGIWDNNSLVKKE